MVMRTAWAVFVLSWLGVLLRMPVVLPGVCIAMPIGFAGGVLAVMELVAIRGGSSPAVGKPLARRALVSAVGLYMCGFVSFVLIYQIFAGP